MKLGLITDIHEHVEHLAEALRQFAHLQVDQVVVLGDIFQMGERIEPTCRLLSAANAIGVWGNHDVGLCFDVDDETRARYPQPVLDFMISLRPRLDVGGCHFTHVEPWLDPEDVADLWYYEAPPENHQQLERIFRAVPNRVAFCGHVHRWLLATRAGVVAWDQRSPVCLQGSRYFVIVPALYDGHFATYDTDTTELVPFCLASRAAQDA